MITAFIPGISHQGSERKGSSNSDTAPCQRNCFAKPDYKATGTKSNKVTIFQEQADLFHLSKPALNPSATFWRRMKMQKEIISIPMTFRVFAMSPYF